jgi:bifunctional oligoribonuclease and PAP phosphatase NrnA
MHTNPDGDSVGSALALRHVLRRSGKDCRVVGASSFPTLFTYLPGVETVEENPDLSASTFDLIIIPDCSDFGRLGELYQRNQATFQRAPIINVDHHVSNHAFGLINILDPAAAATAEQLVYLFSDWALEIDPPAATCLLAGILTDSQGFRTASTTSRTLRAAADLVEAGGLLKMVMDESFNAKPLSTMKLLGRVLSEIQTSDGLLWGEISQSLLKDCQATDAETETVANFLAGVRGIKLAVLFKETRSGLVKVSLRSSAGTDAAAIAAVFGGGGHNQAAGFSVEQSLAEAKRPVLETLKEQLARA